MKLGMTRWKMEPLKWSGLPLVPMPCSVAPITHIQPPHQHPRCQSAFHPAGALLSLGFCRARWRQSAHESTISFFVCGETGRAYAVSVVALSPHSHHPPCHSPKASLGFAISLGASQVAAGGTQPVGPTIISRQTTRHLAVQRRGASPDRNRDRICVARERARGRMFPPACAPRRGFARGVRSDTPCRRPPVLGFLETNAPSAQRDRPRGSDASRLPRSSVGSPNGGGDDEPLGGRRDRFRAGRRSGAA